ncbi:MAG TPA: glycosyltransferase [Anaerolineales bacterium]|nr:glycosyltransferase [Anaerolineales bacterium]
MTPQTPTAILRWGNASVRIGMVLDVYKPHVSGVTNYVSINKQALERAGHEVFVFAFGTKDSRTDEKNVVLSPGLPLARTSYAFGFTFTRAARRLLQSMDVVHVHHPFLSGRLALRYCRAAGIPIVFTNHTRYDLYAQVYLPLLPDQLGQAFLQAYMPAFCRDVNLVIAPSQGLCNVLREMGVEAPIEVIPNGVDLAPFRAGPRPIERSRLGVPQDDVLIIFVGRLGLEKNLAFLLRAFIALHRAQPQVSLLLVGEGPDRDDLRDRARAEGAGEKVFFTGLVPYPDVPRYLAASDLFATASRTEVHPLSVIEALAAGLPVVGIDSPGVSDTIVDGQTGFVAENTVEALTSKLELLVRDKALRRRMAEAASRSAEAYDVDRTSALVAARYRDLVANAKPPRRRPWDHLLDRLLDRPSETA